MIPFEWGLLRMDIDSNPFARTARLQEAHQAHKAAYSIRLDREWIFAPMDLKKLAEAVEIEKQLHGIDRPSEIVMTEEQASDYAKLCGPRFTDAPGAIVDFTPLGGQPSPLRPWPPRFQGIPVRVADDYR